MLLNSVDLKLDNSIDKLQFITNLAGVNNKVCVIDYLGITDGIDRWNIFDFGFSRFGLRVYPQTIDDLMLWDMQVCECLSELTNYLSGLKGRGINKIIVVIQADDLYVVDVGTVKSLVLEYLNVDIGIVYVS